MKIIIVPNEPNPNMTGRHYAVAKALAAAGHEVHELIWDLPQIMTKKQLVRHLFTSLRTGKYKYEDLTMHHIARLPLFWPYINGWLFKWQLRKLYRHTGADIIFAESFTNETSIPKELPYVYDLADDYAAPADVYGRLFYKAMFKLLGVRSTMEKQCREALAVTAVSSVLVNYAKSFNIHVIEVPNMLDVENIELVKADKSTYPTNRYSLVYASMFGKWSRVTETMQTVIALRNKFPNIELTLAGGGPESAKIQQFIEDNNASSYIHYLGYIKDRREWFGIMNRGAIGLNISDKNKWRDAANPIKVIEYCALGKPVVSTNLDGVAALGFANIMTFADNDSKEDGLYQALGRALTKPERAYPDVSKNTLATYSRTKVIHDLVSVFVDAIKLGKEERPA